MKSDSQIREEVIQELRRGPRVTDPGAIGVGVKDGAVTLAGAVSTYARKLATVRAASWVYGVKAVAENAATAVAASAPGVASAGSHLVVTP